MPGSARRSAQRSTCRTYPRSVCRRSTDKGRDHLGCRFPSIVFSLKTANEIESRRHSARPQSNHSNGRDIVIVGDPSRGHSVENTRSMLRSPTWRARWRALAQETLNVAGIGRPNAAACRASVCPNPCQACTGSPATATNAESRSGIADTASIAAAIATWVASLRRENRIDSDAIVARRKSTAAYAISR